MIAINEWLSLLLSSIALATCARIGLSVLNIRHIEKHGKEVPGEFRGEIDEATLARMTDYSVESSRFAIFEGLFSDIVLVAVILFGFLPWLSGLLSAHLGVVPAGLAFFGVLALLSMVLDLPFGIYSTFVIEKKYGFSTITWRMWLADLLKSAAVSVVIMGVLLAAFLALLHYSSLWWVWAWIVFSGFQLLMLWLYPVLIAPLFNRFDPIPDEELKEKIVSLMESKGLKISGVFQVDAGKRSRHTNAYFTGIGKTKRIVLYDTLLASHTAREVLAVLAHELGHWTRRHVLRRVLLMQALAFVVLFASAVLMGEPRFYRTFGFGEVVPYAGLFIVGVVLKPLAFLFTPLGAGISRLYEKQADADACALTPDFGSFADALKRLAKDNLANLHPHPFYVWFYYSHPPLVERIRAIRSCGEKTGT